MVERLAGRRTETHCRLARELESPQLNWALDVTSGSHTDTMVTTESRDKHMRVNCSVRPLPPRPATPSAPSPEDIARERSQMDALNRGFVADASRMGHDGDFAR